MGPTGESRLERALINLSSQPSSCRGSPSPVQFGSACFSAPKYAYRVKPQILTQPPLHTP